MLRNNEAQNREGGQHAPKSYGRRRPLNLVLIKNPF